MIPFNRPHFTGQEMAFLEQVFQSGQTAGNFAFTRRCQQFFERRYGFPKGLLTTSCTDALELSGLLCRLQPGDEVILPSFGFVSTANAFAIQGATLVFADSRADHPNVDLDSIAALLTPRTKVIAVTHYAGVAVDMDALLALTIPRGIVVVEDAAQGIEAFYKGRPLGTLGTFGTLSFHETKNIHCGEGGLLIVNQPTHVPRAEILWEKGTNRASFFRGEVDKYSWVDLGSSYTPSDIMAAVLWAQLQDLDEIQNRRMVRWERYRVELAELATRGWARLPCIPDYAQHNGHIFYLVVENLQRRTDLISHLREHGVNAVFHYQSLHHSPYFADRYRGPELTQADRYSDCLVRLPLWSDLPPEDQDQVIKTVLAWFARG